MDKHWSTELAGLATVCCRSSQDLILLLHLLVHIALLLRVSDFIHIMPMYLCCECSTLPIFPSGQVLLHNFTKYPTTILTSKCRTQGVEILYATRVGLL